jgi:hypothetical protein
MFSVPNGAWPKGPNTYAEEELLATANAYTELQDKKEVEAKAHLDTGEWRLLHVRMLPDNKINRIHDGI